MQARPILYVLFLSTLVGLPALAGTIPGPSPRLDEFVIVEDSRYQLRATADPNGFVVVWQQFADDALRLFARRFSQFGDAQGSEIEVTADFVPESIDVASDPEGSFIVVWDDGEVVARRFSRTGDPLTEEVAISTRDVLEESQPRVAAGPGGSFAAAWNGDDGDRGGVFARRFEADGEPITGEIQVNAYTTGPQGQPRVASFDDGSFLVIWQSQGQLSDFYDVLAQRFSTTGQPLYSARRINDPARRLTIAPNPAVSIDAAGNALVTWDRAARKVSVDGELLGDELDLDVPVWDTAADENGDFVVTWGQSQYAYDLRSGHFGQHFSSDGEAVGGRFRISPKITRIDLGAGPADVASLGGGDFVIAYKRSSLYGASRGPIYGRMLPASRRAGTLDFAPPVPEFLGELDIDWATAERPGTVELTVLRSGGNSGTISVDYFVTGGDAEPGEDYLGTAGTLTFRDDELPWQTFEIELLEDQIPEPSEDILLRLGEPTGDAVLLREDPARVRIYDDDFNLPVLVPSRLGDEVGIDHHPGGRLGSPRVAISDQGDTLVVWERPGPDGGPQSILGQLYDPQGQPRGGVFSAHGEHAATRQGPAIAFDEAGGFLVTWSEEDPDSGAGVLVGRRFDPSGAPDGPEFPVLSCASVPDSDCVEILSPARIARGSDRSWLITAGFSTGFSTGGFRTSDIAAAVLPPQGSAETAIVTANGQSSLPAIAADRSGRFVIAWEDSDENEIFGQLYDRNAQPLGTTLELSGPLGASQAPALGMSRDGRFRMAWFRSYALGPDVFRRHFHPDGEPVDEPVPAPNFPFGEFDQPAVASDPAGNGLAVWVQRGRREVEPLPEDGDRGGIFGRRYGPSGESIGGEFRINPTTQGDQFSPDVALGPHGEAAVVWVSRQGEFSDDSIRLQRFATPLCAAGGSVLCLGGGAVGRFRLEVDWRDFEGRTGRGYATPLTEDTGTFWFFDPDNVEIVVKVLNGQRTNGHFWVFFGALSNVEFNLTVTDTITGSQRQYHNPLGQFASVGDIEALPLGTGSSSAARSDSSAGSWLSAIQPTTGATQTGTHKIGHCTPSSERLCLGDGRFEVRMSWSDFAGNTGNGRVLPLTGDTGGFWFFNSQNIETVVKVIDGRSINGHFWVFYGALSNVEFNLTVTDTVTGQERSYHNPLGEFASVGDILALPSP